jgi:hypothetical protein
MDHRRALAILSLLLLPSLATAQPLDRVVVHDLPNTSGKWQVGEVVVAAPAGQVQHWLSDANSWPVRFPDTQWAKRIGTTPDGRNIIRFKSRVIGRPLTIRIRERPGFMEYDGEGKDVTTQGKNFIERLDSRHTRVVMQTSSEVSGALRMFASPKTKRDRAQRKLNADLQALVRLSHATAAASRPGG